MQGEESELTYNDIYKQMTIPKHAKDNYKNNIGSAKKRDQLLITSGLPLSLNNPQEDIYYNNNDESEIQGNEDFIKFMLYFNN